MVHLWLEIVSYVFVCMAIYRLLKVHMKTFLHRNVWGYVTRLMPPWHFISFASFILPSSCLVFSCIVLRTCERQGCMAPQGQPWPPQSLVHFPKKMAMIIFKSIYMCIIAILTKTTKESVVFYMHCDPCPPNSRPHVWHWSTTPSFWARVTITSLTTPFHSGWYKPWGEVADM